MNSTIKHLHNGDFEVLPKEENIMQECKEIDSNDEIVRRRLDVLRAGATLAAGQQYEKISAELNRMEAAFQKDAQPGSRVETVRNFNLKGHHRCPCASGKLFKNCCRRKTKRV